MIFPKKFIQNLICLGDFQKVFFKFNKKTLKSLDFKVLNMELLSRIELETSPLPRECSTAEL